MDSREVLEGALQDFEGTILTVSHDRYFINRIATRVIEMTPDGAIEYLGNYDDYLEKKRLDEERALNPLTGGATRTQLEREKRKKRLIAEGARRLQDMVSQAEEAISDAEERLSHLEAIMADPETYRDNDKAARVTREHKSLQTRIEALYADWEELSDAAAAGKS
jgi:ATP-binding cassette subfamily F protein 3